jgi:hypothetical protein
MTRLTPDPTFYATAALAAAAGPERLAYVATIGIDPRAPRIVKTIEPEEIARRTGYEKLGPAFLRRAWINSDQFWAAAFIAAGALTLVT